MTPDYEKMDIDEREAYREKFVEQREKLKIDFIAAEMDLIRQLLEIRTYGEQENDNNRT